MNKPADTLYPINALLQQRWSPRAYSTRPIEDSTLFSLFEAARWSPSGGNMQPWAFIVANSQENPEAHSKIVAALSGRNPDWAKNSPVLVVAIARLNPQRPAANRYAYYDLGQAVSHLTFQATEAGLHVHQMGGFDGEKLRQEFELPADMEPLTVLALGYLGNIDELPEDLRDRELTPRTRKPLQEIVFDGQWNKPLEPKTTGLVA